MLENSLVNDIKKQSEKLTTGISSMEIFSSKIEMGFSALKKLKARLTKILPTPEKLEQETQSKPKQKTIAAEEELKKDIAGFLSSWDLCLNDCRAISSDCFKLLRAQNNNLNEALKIQPENIDINVIKAEIQRLARMVHESILIIEAEEAFAGIDSFAAKLSMLFSQKSAKSPEAIKEEFAEVRKIVLEVIIAVSRLTRRLETLNARIYLIEDEKLEKDLKTRIRKLEDSKKSIASDARNLMTIIFKK